MAVNKKTIALTFVVLATLITASVYWSAARNEIFYLCGNFSAGVNETSVIRQLETANLSHYKQTITDQGSVIVFRSNLFYVTSQCHIELNENDEVILATYK